MMNILRIYPGINAIGSGVFKRWDELLVKYIETHFYVFSIIEDLN